MRDSKSAHPAAHFLQGMTPIDLPDFYVEGQIRILLAVICLTGVLAVLNIIVWALWKRIWTR
jgi:hypothetical protein